MTLPDFVVTLYDLDWAPCVSVLAAAVLARLEFLGLERIFPATEAFLFLVIDPILC